MHLTPQPHRKPQPDAILADMERQRATLNQALDYLAGVDNDEQRLAAAQKAQRVVSSIAEKLGRIIHRVDADPFSDGAGIGEALAEATERFKESLCEVIDRDVQDVAYVTHFADGDSPDEFSPEVRKDVEYIRRILPRIVSAVEALEETVGGGR